MKQTKLNKVLSFMLALIMVFAVVTPVIAQDTETQNTNVILHKLDYRNDEALPEVENTGDEMEVFVDARAWDKTRQGNVGFTAYKLDEAEVLASGLEDDNPQPIADAVEADVTAYGAQVVGEEVIVAKMV